MYDYDRRKEALALPDPAFHRLISAIGDTARAVELQVNRLGGIDAAMRQGHGDTLKGQFAEIGSALRVLQRRLGLE